jgi:hypothetical protein
MKRFGIKFVDKTYLTFDEQKITKTNLDNAFFYTTEHSANSSLKFMMSLKKSNIDFKGSYVVDLDEERRIQNKNIV